MKLSRELFTICITWLKSSEKLTHPALIKLPQAEGANFCVRGFKVSMLIAGVDEPT